MDMHAEKLELRSKGRYRDLILALLLLFLGIFLAKNRSELFMRPSYAFTTVNHAHFGNDGKEFVIDQGREVINVVNAEHVLTGQLRGGRYDRFFYAEAVAEDKNGTIYIADEAYDEKGHSEARVVSLKNGKYEVIYKARKSKIYELQEYEGTIYFLCEDDAGLGLYVIKNGAGAVPIRKIYVGDVLNGASVDLSTGVVAVTARRGDVRILPHDASTWITVKKDGEHLMPQGIVARNGRVFFTDLYQGRICALSESMPSGFTTIFREDNASFYYLSASSDASRMLCTDYASYYDITVDKFGMVDTEYIDRVPYGEFKRTLILWGLLAGFVVLSLFLLRFVPGLLLLILKKESRLRMASVLVAVLVVSCFIAWSLLAESYGNEDDAEISEMKFFSDLVVNKIETRLLSDIAWETDYQSSSYNKIHESLDEMIARAIAGGKDYYYVIYGVREDNSLCYLMNYADNTICGEPYYLDPGYYLDAYENGNSYALQSRDADGLWLYVVAPVTDDQGKAVAVLEVGTDLSYRQQERNNRTINILLNVFCSAAVMMMFIVEMLFLMSYLERKRSMAPGTAPACDTIPLRTVTMLSYASSTMQDAFITTLSAKVYRGTLPVPKGIAIGFPLSCELLMMAVFALVGGKMVNRLGSKKTLFAGTLIEIGGFAVCAVAGGYSYAGLAAGNILIGIGMGIIAVTGNTLAAIGDSLDATADAFSDIMAGSLSGITIGAGLASLLYPMGGSRLAYAVSGSLMVPSLLLIYFSGNVRPDERAGYKEGGDRISFGRFFFNVRVCGFFLLALVPFMVSISYREYFLPMYVTEHGIDENRVGQIFLACGLLVLYAGPYMSKYMIRRFGTFRSIVAASAAMGLNMFIFVLYPSVGTAVAGVLILSAITSFAYTCQYTFFEQLPDCEMYGDSEAMGVYSIFENLGQTIGPVVYGAMVGFGYRTGLSIMGGVLLGAILLYALLLKVKKQYGFFE